MKSEEKNTKVFDSTIIKFIIVGVVNTVVGLASHLKKVIDTKFSIWYYIKAVSLIAN